MCSITTAAVIVEPALIARMEGLCRDVPGSGLVHSITHGISKLAEEAMDYSLPAHIAVNFAPIFGSFEIYSIFSALVILTWLILVLVGTFTSPSSKWSILSLRTSITELCSARQNSSKLNILDVFRVLSICWVMANHLGSEGRTDILDRLPSGQAFKQAVHNHPIFGALLGNSALGVEIFLVGFFDKTCKYGRGNKGNTSIGRNII